ncbi:SIS domain-containing protein [Ruegeria sp. HKCCD6228]|jgi:DNA-binding MurR/RpiR family transcriptional regulator|uniref:SIS domain-containing protein n=1 Tax=Ruegeria atlantica TaxID=81569 RepID=A0AA90Z1L6_9RHOB|nr:MULTISPECIES: MurR/RpiR family transcriptional regulator [Ruegeria]MCA0905410.1 MurR/RpiR family transcriptional regulator [Ruegeria marisrubri]NOC84208.1 SIS domain-containing protein [Ruegeria sp. HKCCD6428]NOC91484.1 SIS domain-containing protein [Ruegeria sp. HKCCD6604]NOD28665.1 SIS domain-containing protein [Ruegeria atlantica]NOD98258.1 SIS domain-containing protein [Ruegeria sp. HKCCD6228]
MATVAKLVKQRIQDELDDLTRSERQLASVLLQDYPMAGLQSITKLAAAAQVSTPTVIRMARKLGFDGFPDLQDALREEVAAQIKKPISKRDAWVVDDEAEHPTTRFAQAVWTNMRHTLERLDKEMFDAVARLLAETERHLYVVGGRITRSNADYLFNHMQIIRPNVTMLGNSANVWPQYLLDMDESSVLVIFDIRRYEAHLEKLAQVASGRGVTVVLFTDQWGSPIGKTANYSFHALVEAPSSWDSTIALQLISETLIAEVQEARWEESKERIEELERFFSSTRIFRNQD